MKMSIYGQKLFVFYLYTLVDLYIMVYDYT